MEAVKYLKEDTSTDFVEGQQFESEEESDDRDAEAWSDDSDSDGEVESASKLRLRTLKLHNAFLRLQNQETICLIPSSRQNPKFLNCFILLWE